jgi:rhodanese-related sulfurtransferase
MKSSAGKLFSAFGFTQLVMIVAIGAALFLAYTPWRWGKVRDELLAKFPQVDHIDGSTLERWIRESKADATRQGPTVLDVRSAAEFNAGHLPSAKNVRAGAKPGEMGLLTTPENREAELRRPVVVYCAVGYDSSEVAEYLKRNGFTRVQMLDGGIFRWANDARPLVDGNGAVVNRVHPGASVHVGLLERSARASIP